MNQMEPQRTSKTENLTRMSVGFEASVIHRLRKRARAEGRSIGYLVNKLCAKQLDADAKEEGD